MTIRHFKKGDIEKSFHCEGDVALVTMEIGGIWVSNPTVALLEADGWQEYIRPVPPPYVPTYEEKVVSLIRERFDENSEAKFSRWNIEVNILHTKELTDDEIAELKDYSEYVAWCHEEAKKNE